MIRTLKWYLGKDLAKITLLATAVFTLLMSVLAVIEPLRQRGLSGGQAMQLFTYSLPVMLSFTLPVAALFAATFVYGRFSQDNELMACRASGISTLSLMAPAIWLGVLVSLVTLTMGLYVAPKLLWASRQAVRSNLERIAFHGLKSNRRLDLGKRVFYADRVDPERHGLAGVLAMDMRDPHNVLVLSATEASLDFAQRDQGAYVSFQADNPVVFRQKGGTVGMEDEQDMRHTMLEEIMDDEPRMYDWSRLCRVWANPAECPGVQAGLRRIQRLVCVQAFLKDALSSFASTGRYASLTELPPVTGGAPATRPSLRRVEIRTRQVERGIDDSLLLGKSPALATAPAEGIEAGQPLTADNCVVIRVYNGNELDQELRCFQATLSCGWDEARDAPRAWLELSDALVNFSANARETGGRHDRLGLGPFAMPEEVTAAGSQVKLDHLMKLSNKAFGADSIDKAVAQLKNNTIRLLLARTQSEMNFRLSYAISTVFLVMLGAALGLLLRGGQALAAFAIGAVPTSLTVLTLYMGKEMIRHINVAHAAPLGMAIVWGGVAVLIAGTLYVYLAPLRK